VWDEPELMEVAFEIPVMVIGVDEANEPFDSGSKVNEPQHLTVPVLNRAQVLFMPALIAMAPSTPPTVTGVIDPSPAYPS
jgi:hypothetical protein